LAWACHYFHASSQKEEKMARFVRNNLKLSAHLKRVKPQPSFWQFVFDTGIIRYVIYLVVVVLCLLLKWLNFF
jgi:hypothetical protein